METCQNRFQWPIRITGFPATFKLYRDLIRQTGVKEQFTLRGRTASYRYYYSDRYKYWIIGVVLNRAKLAETKT
jgi:hypothetical protein